MSYIALYREWRPKFFRDIVGQEHITRTLKNQISQGRVAHAYLFCGTRGTGKTSTAKVLAKAVNCLHSEDGEPCGKCEICTGLDNGSIMDVVEIDAASNNGVDNIRELRDDVKYHPSKCRYKVYIIDEVHMLSTAAFNALLKTLEEPPSHIIFILATTEFQKVPSTILSRCQRFDFKRIRVDDIVKRLRKVSEEYGVEVDDKALNLIARNADGALRDSLSIFDQCISMGGKTVKYDDVVSILGITTDEYLFKITDAILEGSVQKCISLIDDLVINGKDIFQFIKDFTMHFRNLLVSRMGESALDILNVSHETFEALIKQTKKFSTETILKNINILQAAEADAKWVSQPRITLEMAAIRMCKKELRNDPDSLLERIANIEKAIRGGRINVSAEQEEEDIHKDEASDIKREESAEKVDSPKVQEKHEDKLEKHDNEHEKHEKEIEKHEEEIEKHEDAGSIDEIYAKWPKVLESINKEGHKALYSMLNNAKLCSLAGGTLVISLKYDINRKLVEREDNRKIIENKILLECGFKVKIRCVTSDEVAADKEQDVGKEQDAGLDMIKKAKGIFGSDIVEVEK